MLNSRSRSRSKVHDNWKDFQESAILDQKLQRMAVAKALDLPWDEMRDVTVNKGLTGPVVAALSAAMLAGGAGLGMGLFSLFSSDSAATTVPDPVQKIIELKEKVEVDVIPPTD
jgi:hypothetical protein